MVEGFTIDMVRNSTMPAPLYETHKETLKDFLQQVFSLVSEVDMPGESRHITDDMCQTLYMEPSPEFDKERSHWIREYLKSDEEVHRDFLQQFLSAASAPPLFCCSKHYEEEKKKRRDLVRERLKIRVRTGDFDDSYRDRERHEKLVNAYRAWFHSRNSLADPEVLQDISPDQKSEGRSFFNTINGRLGFGPPDIRTGDLLCAFNITQQVLVLRAADVKTLQEGNIHSMSNLAKHSEFFHLIGDTYLSGCMHGAAFTAAGRGSDRMFVLA